MILIRYKKLETDLLVNCSIPWKTEEYSEKEWEELVEEAREVMEGVKTSLDDEKLSSIL